MTETPKRGRRRRRSKRRGGNRDNQNQNPNQTQNPNQPNGPQIHRRGGDPRQQGPARHGPMTFLDMLAIDVDSDVRRRGEIYFRQGRVFEPDATAERMSAEVHGKGGNYRVTMDLTRDEERKRSVVNAICGCPYFTGGSGYCKHIWAVLCFADAAPNGAFKAPEGHQSGMHPLKITKMRSRHSNVVSAGPDATGRIRGFSAGAQAAPQAEPQHGKRQSQRPDKSLMSWREALKVVGHVQRDVVDTRQRSDTATDVYYVVDLEQTTRTGHLCVQVYRLASPADGQKQLVTAPVDPRALDLMPPGPDRDLLTRLFGVALSTVVRTGQWDEDVVPLRRGHSLTIADALRPALLEQLAATGRFGWLDVDDAKLEANGPFDRESFKALGWDGGDTFRFDVAVAPIKQGNAWMLRGEFRREGQTLPVTDALAIFADGHVLLKDKVARFEKPDARAFGWIAALKQIGQMEVPRSDQAAFLRTYAGLQSAPTLDLPEASGWRVIAGEPKPKLVFLAMPAGEMPPVLTANYEFTYETPPAAATGETSSHAADPSVAPSPEAATGDGQVADAQVPDGQVPEGQAAESQPAAPQGRGRRGRRGAQNPAGSQGPQAAPASQGAPGSGNDRGLRVVVRREREREEVLIKDLCAHQGVQPSAGRGMAGCDVFVDPTGLADLISTLTARGWSVEAEGQRLRVAKSFQVDVTTSSGMDWLDLRALFDFGDGVAAQLPRILEAVRSGADRVVLGDGSVGILPAAWLAKLEPVLRMGENVGNDGSLRYQGTQAAFLDALVSEATEAHLDKPFAEFRAKLASFSGVTQAEPAKAFVGELRPYQRQGLGWLEFLDEFALGGCLADDMGLGKTVQVLAHLQKRRDLAVAAPVVAADDEAKPAPKRGKRKTVGAAAKSGSSVPSLIVAPTSLIHNWVDEATRFTPDLRVYAHRGASRHRDPEDFAGYDLVVTSYGTMRSDVDMLATINFDYIVLDEAQAIKNESTQVAQAARLLKAKRRLVMSGTPVENRLSELGSLFRFLNPGMLDSSQGFAELFSGSGKLSSMQLQSLARLLKPFLLRRTKEQVLPELPGKTENTVYCVLEDDQRKEYDQLAAFYRDSLQKKIDTSGFAKSRMHVLEALLRLRQLACHPGLIDEKRALEPSAKLDLLEEQLDEVMASGRKALVFSQFTSMLAIVRARLDAKGIVYEYLDGSTTDRKERVDHFQTDDKVRVFLISLKAGGVGLNLTAADYCFILDPWWNPASEAQAIDRAHRIGQKNHVFAYRLIARGTVEEKILALQASKRQLVEGIIANDGDVLSGITAKDLDFLLE